MRLKFPLLGLVLLLALVGVGAQDPHPVQRSELPKADLFIEPSVTPIPGGKARLTISALTRRAETYGGTYQFNVSPYFFKSEKGKLSVDVSDGALKKLAEGVTVEFAGQATTDGSNKTRPIKGKATPVDEKQGTVSLRIGEGSRALLFNTSYRFGEPRE